MKNYAKVLLYAYPLLRTVGRDYEEHIKNKAVLSYDSRKSASELAEYLAGEILQMRNLEWLKARVEEILQKLSEEERSLVAMRYFGKRGKNREGTGAWTERTYFRRQQRLGEKLVGMLSLSGVTEEVFLREFATIEPFKTIGRKVEEGRDEKISARERRWLCV